MLVVFRCVSLCFVVFCFCCVLCLCLLRLSILCVALCFALAFVFGFSSCVCRVCVFGLACSAASGPTVCPLCPTVMIVMGFALVSSGIRQLRFVIVCVCLLTSKICKSFG